jgi:hypothetical protein
VSAAPEAVAEGRIGITADGEFEIVSAGPAGVDVFEQLRTGDFDFRRFERREG